jgi:pimeloyl-ACP methyl ester carboxylesterase
MEKSNWIEGVELHYQVLGQGLPVMLVHGFGEDGRIWEKIVGALSEHCQLIIPDLPGSGKSEDPLSDDEASFPTLDDLAGSLKAILEAEGLGSCTMIGHSMGGYITLCFARAYPHLLNGLGLFHSTADPDTEEKKEIRKKGIKFVREHGAALFLRQSMPNLFGETFRKEHPEELELLIGRGNGFTARALIQYYRAMIQRTDHKDVLAGWRKPALFIMGDEDKTVHLQDVLFQSHLPAISHVYVWTGVAHMGMRERTEESVQAIRDFVEHVQAFQAPKE